MANPSLSPSQDDTYWQQFSGKFYGLLHWSAVDQLWQDLGADAKPWYVFDLKAEVPQRPANPAEMQAFLTEARALVNQRRDESICGALYVDDRETPTMLRIYDPKNMGAACSHGGAPVKPRWILSRQAAHALPSRAIPAPKPGLLHRLHRVLSPK